MALDEATTGLMAQLAAQGGRPLHEQEPAEVRALGGHLAQLAGPGPELASVWEETLAAGDGGSFLVRVLAPANPGRVILYFHGGGWVTGHIDEFDTLGRRLAERTGSAVVLVNYRKAPEHPYPAAVEDAWTALTWTAGNLSRIAGGPVPVVVAGDSAGGNLAAVLALRARDRSGPPLAAQVLVYPVTDAGLDAPGYRAPENQLLLNRDSMVWFWGHYAPDERRGEPDASPLRAASHIGLPPALVLLAEYDVLRAEGEAYAGKLAEAGVPVRIEVVPGQMHGFFTMVNILPGHDTGLGLVADFLADQPAGSTETENVSGAAR
jgi:acetyl esterase